LCNHVHLPIQSGSNRVLDGMQRLYSLEQYMERVSWMRAANRDISLTSDIIVGFPGESESDFEETLSLLDQVQYDCVFSFKYSPRPNTPSLKLEDAIPDEEKTRRLLVVQDRQREIQRISYRRHLGETVEVLVEGRNEARKQVMGRTSQNKTLNFTVGDRAAPESGEYVAVLTTATFPNSLLGEMVH
jgi:tRNA-2-methylthio-N6-dimethylallyladenosine synthase